VQPYPFLTNNIFIAFGNASFVSVIFEEKDSPDKSKQLRRHATPGLFLNPILVLDVEQRVSGKITFECDELGEIHLRPHEHNNRKLGALPTDVLVSQEYSACQQHEVCGESEHKEGGETLVLVLKWLEVADVDKRCPPLLVALYGLLVESELLFGGPTEQKRPDEEDEPDCNQNGH